MLLRELIGLELELRRDRGERPTRMEYHPRFPGESDVVDAFFEGVATEDLSRGPEATRPMLDRPGSRIGPYKLLHEVGKGGMGVVYMAEQEKPVRRRVAVKIIKPGMGSEQVIARFEAERQALAIMDHPNIARVLDAGTTDSGLPFFVMELVKGVPFTAYCDQAHLPIAERLKLFIPVCQAIQHAHLKGIIHRDIKPSNVLVTLVDGKPVPKVIDFGLAKAINQRLTERTLFTQLGAVVGTLEYMSPEQAELSALDVDTRTDVYSLGAMLYGLLTGSTPLECRQLRAAGFAEILRRIKEEEPAKPSTRLSSLAGEQSTVAANRGTEATRLTRVVRGDLDWIVMKALEKDRSRRYETANELARDVERFLAGDSVEACPPSALYRLSKFTRKHRAGLAATALMVVLLAGAAAISTWQAVRAVGAERLAALRLGDVERANIALGVINARERDASQLAMTRARLAIDAIGTFTEAVQGNSLLQQSQFEEMRKTLLSSPLKFYRELSTTLEKGRDPDEETRASLATAYEGMAKLASEIGSKDDAVRASEHARDLLAALSKERPGEPEYRRRHAAAIGIFAVRVATIVARRAEVEQSYETAAGIQEALVREYPDRPAYRADLAFTCSNYGERLVTHENLERSRPFLERAVELLTALVREQPANSKHLQTLAQVYNSVAYLERNSGQIQPSIDACKKSIELWESLLNKFPKVAAYKTGLAVSFNTLAWAQNEPSRINTSLEYYEKARDIHQELANEYPAVAIYRQELARNYSNLGTSRRSRGEMSLAIDCYARAIELLEPLVRENPTVWSYPSDLGNIWHSLSELHRSSRNISEAIRCLERWREAFSGLESQSPQNRLFRYEIAHSWFDLADLRMKEGHIPEAIRCAELGKDILVESARRLASSPQRWIDLAWGDDRLGRIYRNAGRRSDSDQAFEQALAIREKYIASDPKNARLQRDMALSLCLVSVRSQDAGQVELAASYLRQAIAITVKYPPANSVDSYNAACFHSRLGGLADRPGSGVTAVEGRYEADQGLQWLRRAIEAGYRDLAWMKSDTGLDSLRARPDFQVLMLDLAFPTEPFAR